MSMAERERAEMTPQSTAQEMLGKMTELTSSYLEIIEALKSLRSHQVVVKDNFETISKKLEVSDQERNALLSKVNEVIAGLRKKEDELVQTIKKLAEQIEARSVAKEKELNQALQEVRNLKGELLRGFHDLHVKNRGPISHQLYKLATMSLGSVVGGVIVYLLLKLLVH